MLEPDRVLLDVGTDQDGLGFGDRLLLLLLYSRTADIDLGERVGKGRYLLRLVHTERVIGAVRPEPYVPGSCLPHRGASRTGRRVDSRKQVLGLLRQLSGMS